MRLRWISVPRLDSSIWGRQLFRGRGHLVGDLGGRYGRLGDDLVLVLDLLLLELDLGQVGVGAEAADELAVEVMQGEDVGPDEAFAALAAGELHVQVLDRLARGHDLGHRGGAAGVGVEELAHALADVTFRPAAMFEHVQGRLVDEGDLRVGVHAQAGIGHAGQDALGEAELGFDLADHVPDVRGQVGQLVFEAAGELGLVVARGHLPGEGLDDQERPEDEAPADEEDDADEQDDDAEADRGEDVALGGGGFGQFSGIGRHAHRPAGLGHAAYGEDLGFALPVVVERAAFERQGLADEFVLRQILGDQALVRGMGQDHPVLVHDEAVAARAEADGVEEGGGEDRPFGKDGHAADELAGGVLDRLGHGQDVDVLAALGLHDLIRDEAVLASDHGLDVVAARVVGAGHGFHVGVVAGHDLAREVEGEHGPVGILVAFKVGFEALVGPFRVGLGEGRDHGGLVGQGTGQADGVVQELPDALGQGVGGLRQVLLLELQGHAVRGGADIEDEPGDGHGHGQGYTADENGVDALPEDGHPASLPGITRRVVLTAARRWSCSAARQHEHIYVRIQFAATPTNSLPIVSASSGIYSAGETHPGCGLPHYVALQRNDTDITGRWEEKTSCS